MSIFKSIKLIIIAAFTIIMTYNVSIAYEENSSIAILKSHNSSNEYASQHLGPYTEIFNDIINTMNQTNMKYEVITERDISSGINPDRYKIIIIPMCNNLPDNIIRNLEKFTSYGGKLIISVPGGKYTGTTHSLANIVGVSLLNPTHLDSPAKVDWKNVKIIPRENTFPPSTRINFISTNSSTETIAEWDNYQIRNTPAVTKSDKGCYITWQWGTDGNISFNVFSIKNAINKLIPGLTSLETVKITPRKYEDYIKEINELQNQADGALSTVIQADLSVPLTKIQEQIYMSEVHKALFENYYNDRQYAIAQQEYDNAKKSIIEAYARAIPSRLVEGRALWLDRGTIVSVKKPEDMKLLFDKIEEAGINVIYLETINAGFPIYPSKYIDQNPLTKGYDPLKTAIYEAHKRDIELHAWTWIFAVGNTRHNPLINKPESYPGPIISNNFYDGALLGLNGNMLPDRKSVV